jgi:hypothetical protein
LESRNGTLEKANDDIDAEIVDNVKAFIHLEAHKSKGGRLLPSILQHMLDTAPRCTIIALFNLFPIM